MAKFYKCNNNGVTAIASEEVMRKAEERRDLYMECDRTGRPVPNLPPIRPIFTFSVPDHHLFPYMTGSIGCMNTLLRGHQVEPKGIWVPFSNGTADDEMEMVTSLDDAIEAFGLVSSRPEDKDMWNEILTGQVDTSSSNYRAAR